MKLLHIVATPRATESSTLRVSTAFIGALRDHHPDVVVDQVDLYHQDLPAVAGANIETKYGLMVGKPIDRAHQESWCEIESLIAHFKSADAYLVSTPMWNLSIPYALKYYIDCLVQPGYTFRIDHTTGTPVPMVLGKKMVCVTSRGGDFSATSPLHAYDFEEPYLRAIFGYIGITDLEFVNAQPMDYGPELREAALAQSVERVRQIAGGLFGTASECAA
jgi:FMN-dependent NADH-azoreductase